MRNLVTMIVLAASMPLMAADINGIWRTQPGDNGATLDVQIGPCGANTCGKIVRVNGADADIVGRGIIFDMQKTGDNQWDNGKIWAPDRDKTYNSNMTLSGDRLEVEGCVLMICRSQIWTRLQ